MSDFRLDILDGIIPVVAVIIWIVSSMMKVAKKGPRPGRSAPMTPQEPAPSGDPQEQLRQFLQGLSGSAGQQAPGPPPVFEEEEEEEEMEAPLRVVPPPPPPIRVAAATPRVQAVPNAYERVARPVHAPGSAMEARDPLAQETMRPVSSRRSQPARRWLRRHLNSAKGVRNAVILREVLGPPLGMRKQGG
jgi:hypothetical protein